MGLSGIPASAEVRVGTTRSRIASFFTLLSSKRFSSHASVGRVTKSLDLIGVPMRLPSASIRLYISPRLLRIALPGAPGQAVIPNWARMTLSSSRE